MLPFVDAKHPTCTSNWRRDFTLKSSTSDHGLENTDLAHPKSMVQCINSLMFGCWKLLLCLYIPNGLSNNHKVIRSVTEMGKKSSKDGL